MAIYRQRCTPSDWDKLTKGTGLETYWVRLTSNINGRALELKRFCSSDSALFEHSGIAAVSVDVREPRPRPHQGWEIHDI